MKELREFITLVEHAEVADDLVEEEVLEEQEVESFSLQDALSEVVFKLRAHSEMDEMLTEGYRDGIEAGCEIAAEMIENLIKNMVSPNE